MVDGHSAAVADRLHEALLRPCWPPSGKRKRQDLTVPAPFGEPVSTQTTTPFDNIAAVAAQRATATALRRAQQLDAAGLPGLAEALREVAA